MSKMNVLTFVKTNHVLGAVTRTTEPGAAATPQQIAAGGIRLRDAAGEKTLVTIRESDLAVQLVDYKTEVLQRPQIFALEDGQPEQKNVTDSAALNVTLNGTQITVTLPANVSQSTSVWCHI